jgi:hypothetical protein
MSLRAMRIHLRPWATCCVAVAALAWGGGSASAAMMVVKTNQGSGADGRVSENVNVGTTGVGPLNAVIAGSGTGTATIDVRSNGTLAGNKDRNEWGVFRFDLSPANLGGFPRSAITSAELWLVYQRTGPQNGTIDFFGVNANVAGEDTWAEGSMSFNNMPGMKFDGSTDSSADATTSAGGRILADTTGLGSVVLAGQVKPTSVADVVAGGTGVVKLTGANLLSFLQAADTDDLVTFLVGNETAPTSTQLRFASKELLSLEGGAPVGVAGDWAARLVVEVVPEPASGLLLLMGFVGWGAGRRRCR